MSRPIEIGDVVIDETSGHSHIIERIESGDIYLYGEGRVIMIDDQWKLEDSPNHVIRFDRGPGDMSITSLMRDPVPQFLLLVEILYGQDEKGNDAWRIFEDGKITFNSKNEAIEYFFSFGRHMLLDGREYDNQLGNINLALYKAWATQSFERNQHMITDLLLFYKRDLEKRSSVRIGDDYGNETYRVSVMESNYVPLLETMVKSAGKR
jgi:hypothetical protein